MARVRLIALAARAATAFAAFAGCARSDAGPPPASAAVSPPPGWQALPQIAKLTEAAAKSGDIAVDSAAAWGDTARGCYAFAITVRGGHDQPESLARALAGGLVVEPRAAGIAVHDVIADATSAALAFERAPYRGRLVARQNEGGPLAARACFWNDREPEACEAACAGWLR